MSLRQNQRQASQQRPELILPEKYELLRQQPEYKATLQTGQVTLTDIMDATPATAQLFTGTIEINGRTYFITPRLLTHPEVRVQTFQDRVNYAREKNSDAFGFALNNPEAICGIIAAYERLTWFERAGSRVQGNITAVEEDGELDDEGKARKIAIKQRKIQSYDRAIQTLDAYIREDLKAQALMNITRTDRVKSAKQARESTTAIIKYLANSLADIQAQRIKDIMGE